MALPRIHGRLIGMVALIGGWRPLNAKVQQHNLIISLMIFSLGEIL
jgi:hypothetical protein